MAATPDDSSPTAASAPTASSTSSNSKAAQTATATSSGVASGTTNAGAGNAPQGHSLRRARTSVDDAGPMRRRLPAPRSEASFEAAPRRSSNFSEYSLGEARDLLYPQAQSADVSTSDSSSLASLSLAFALLPALGGVLFQNGSSVVTDVMLLGLAGVFLHWSVTQPWVWYHAAQQVRIQEESHAEAVVDDETDAESQAAEPSGSTPLDDVPEESESTRTPPPKGQSYQPKGKQMTEQQRAAMGELYTHEVLALLSCFALPLMSAYLLHAIRSQLSRPSEGLVSNYNLTIFLLVSELRAFSHMIKLIQARTLHLQRVIHGNPYGSSVTTSAQLEDALERIERLETRTTADEILAEREAGADSGKARQEAVVTREVRNAIQPELDALNRAVRRYEKKATLLQMQTESRFSNVDSRLDDAIALAAAAAKNSSSNKNLLAWTMDSIISIILFPFNTILQILVLPLKGLFGLLNRGKQDRPQPSKGARNGRLAKAPAQARYGGDRLSARVSRK